MSLRHLVSFHTLLCILKPIKSVKGGRTNSFLKLLNLKKTKKNYFDLKTELRNTLICVPVSNFGLWGKRDNHSQFDLGCKYS